MVRNEVEEVGIHGGDEGDNVLKRSTNAPRTLSTCEEIGREKSSQLVILKRGDDKLSMAFRSATRSKKAQRTWVNISLIYAERLESRVSIIIH